MRDVVENKFIETLGMIWQAEGAPRIAGQVLGYLILAETPRSLTDIATALGVSKASVSTNVRLLEMRGMSSRVSNLGSRQDLWQASPDPKSGTLLAMSDRFRRNADQIGAIAREFADTAADKREKVVQYAEFYEKSSDFLRQWAAMLDAPAAEPAAENDEKSPRKVTD